MDSGEAIVVNVFDTTLSEVLKPKAAA